MIEAWNLISPEVATQPVLMNILRSWYRAWSSAVLYARLRPSVRPVRPCPWLAGSSVHEFIRAPKTPRICAAIVASFSAELSMYNRDRPSVWVSDAEQLVKYAKRQIRVG